MAHITGGGLEANIARAIPEGLKAKVDYRWQIPEVFQALRDIGDIDPDDMWTTFNMGIGMVLICALDAFEQILDDLKCYDALVIGEVIED